VLRAENLSKTYQHGAGKAVCAVDCASFSVDGGEVFGLLGPNGAGKTTLLRILATIIQPTSGYCWVDGVRSDEATDATRRQIGFLSGNTRLYGRLTPAEVLLYFGRLYGMETEAIKARTEELASVLEMGATMKRRCETLSTGQSQKVNIARVLLHDPKVLILDEPTLGLDILTSRSILDFIRGARERGRAIIYSTHHMSEAEYLCDRVAFIHGGRILAIGAQGELFAQTQTQNLHDAFLSVIDRQGAQAP